MFLRSKKFVLFTTAAATTFASSRFYSHKKPEDGFFTMKVDPRLKESLSGKSKVEQVAMLEKMLQAESTKTEAKDGMPNLTASSYNSSLPKMAELQHLLAEVRKDSTSARKGPRKS